MRPERGDDWLAELPGEVRNRLVQARSSAGRLRVWYPSRVRHPAAGRATSGGPLGPSVAGGAVRRLVVRT